MYTTRTLAIAVFVAVAHARFGLENSVQGVIGAIGGNNGQAATLAGASIGTLLAGANACAKLALADKVAALTGAGALDAAKALVQAEKNFNPFAVTIPSFCSDATLPATAALRGILPLVDPAVPGAAAANAASAASLAKPVNAKGLSVADIVKADGSVNFTPQSSAGVVGAEVVAGGGAGGVVAVPASSAAAVSIATIATIATPIATPIATIATIATPIATATATAIATAAPVGTATATAIATAAPVGTAAPAAPPAAAGNLQTFTGALGAAANPITFSGDSKRPFKVNGDTFVNFSAAAARTCDIQFNVCANAANSGKAVVFADCNTQKTACTAAQAATTVTSFGAAGAATEAATPGGDDASAPEACPSQRIKRREEAEKRAEKSKKLALLRTILQKRAELAVLEEQLL